MFGRRDSAGPERGMPRRRGRDSYAWWEIALMALVGVLILGGVVLLLRMVFAGEGASPTPTQTPQATFGPTCGSDEWEDPATGQCVPREVCASGLEYDEGTNTCQAPAPTLANVDPRTGPAEGGTELTLTGSGFQPGATVTINGVPGIDTRVVDGATITTSTPPASVYFGVDVVVTNPDGQSVKLDNIFEYAVPPIDYITEIVPDVGSTQGGEAVVIKGRDFVDGTVVSFRGRPATDVTVLNPQTMRVTIPPGPVGKVNVNVRIPGIDAYTLENGFRYANQAPRRVLLVRPKEGAQAGGTKVTITGTGFDKGATVIIGKRKATKVTVVGSTRISAITPAGPLGAAPVAVRNPGLPAAILEDAFTYVEAPTIESVKPAKIPETGDVVITIIGTGFLDGAEVSVGGSPATKVKVVSATEIRATAPPGDVGKAAVVVANPDQPAAELKRAVTYVAAEPQPTPSPTAPPTIKACRSFTLPAVSTPPGSDLILTDADLFPVSVQSPRLTGTSFVGAPGSGSITWKADPPRIVWSASVSGGGQGTINFSYQAANCSGVGRGTVNVSTR